MLATSDGAYVSLRGSGEVAFVLDDATIVRRAPVGEEPVGLSLSPDGKRLYVANMTSRSLSVLDAATLARVRTDIPVGTAFLV